jgi:hypothetical protein
MFFDRLVTAEDDRFGVGLHHRLAAGHFDQIARTAALAASMMPISVRQSPGHDP